MIAKLTGTVDSIGEGHVVLDVNGVGYLVQCTGGVLRNLTVGEPAVLAVETQVREDAIRLFGFKDEREKGWFNLLQTVQGVGSKVAVSLLSTLSTGELATALSSDDKATVARAPGVGPRLAARIASELKGKVPDFLMSVAGAVAAPVVHPAAADAVSALVNLGYPRFAAVEAVNKAVSELGDSVTSQAVIRVSLRSLAKAA